MKLEPSDIPKHDPIKDLPPLRRLCYYAAVATAFVSIFVWVFKILFF
ncbi:MAG TPA: hypothetical protein VHA56_13670 [Mucilaginibacter sp.]|nr:hypothetical protein [Mucilaginibacter sp.]